MPGVSDALLQNQLHELLGGRAHILEPLPERNDREVHALKVLHHLHGTPAVECDLTDVEPFSEALDELFDVAVMNDISFRGLQVSLTFPYIVRNVISIDSLAHVLFRYPEVGQDHELVLFIQRREHQHKRRDICRGGEVEPTVADPAFEVVLVYRKGAPVPFLHRHPAHSLLDPLVESELPERVLLGRVLFCRLAGRLDLVDPDRDPERRVCFLPYLRVRPVVVLVRAVDHRIEGRIDLPAFQEVLCFLVRFIADGFRVRPGGRYKEIQRLHPRVAGALGHNVKELPVRLGMQLIKDHTVDIEPVLRVRLCRQYLVETVRRQIHDPLRGRQDLDPAVQCRAHTDHVCSDLKYDGRLLSIRCASVDLCTFLTVAACEQERDRSRELRFSHFLGDLNVGGVELPVSVGFDDAEDVPNDLFLPVNQGERLPGPRALGVAEALDERNRVVGFRFIVDGVLCLELRRGVFLHSPQIITSQRAKK